MSDWQDRLVDAGLHQLHGEQPPDQTAVILHRLQTELGAVTVMPPRPRRRAGLPLLLLSSALGAAAALLLVWLLMSPPPAAAPTVARLELAALAGSIECTEPATALAPEHSLVLRPGEHAEWRAQVGGALHSRGDAGAELAVRPFGVLTTTPHTTLEVRSMEFTLRNGAMATGALTFAVVAGVATWHTLSRSETVAAGQDLRIEASAGGGDHAAELALANDKLVQQNRELQTQLEALQTQLSRKVAASVAEPKVEEPPSPPPVAAETPTGEPVFADPGFQELLASIDWNSIGSASAEMGPKLAALMQALAEGKQPSMEEAIEIQKLNGKLLEMVPKLLKSGLPGFGPNGVFSHPLVASNSLASMLDASGQPLSADQKATLQNLVRAFSGENQTTHDTPHEFALEELAAEAAMKDRFYQEMANNLTPEQRRLMYPDGAGKVDGSSLFSSGLIWSVYDRSVPAANAGEFARTASQRLEQRLGLDERQAAGVRAVIERVAGRGVDWQDKGLPIELRGGPQSFLRSGRGAAALAVQLQWMRELQGSGLLTPQQLEQLRGLDNIFVPVPR